MSEFTAACVQLRCGKSVVANLEQSEGLIREAAGAGAHYIQTPEMTNVLVRSRDELFERIGSEDADLTVARFKAIADELKVWIHAGSLAILLPDGKVANRGLLISPEGRIAARYDKIHMFDVDLPNGESWRESATYEPGSKTLLADLPWIKMGMAVCYDVRFPAIFRTQARMGAGLLTMPAAFTRQTGEAHWHVLQRARAIENGAYVVSAAQGGLHEDGRETYGHSLMVDPWGRVIGEIDGDQPGFVTAVIRPEEVAKARQRIPAIANERDFAASHAQEEREIPA
ncbi:carbon-nitrogen hydrolase family protein [Roseibium polysiphoniae]|uniref:Carbon-nitrogen hydrolase family protein n=1 Tax=Roseibium polysiphoniae TaxID=2571221 RepID=A0ABR9CBF6_9HYPH|nr:carbon-nitrogen hydrolase family protein [Roseibium polysiphoniae]MBD8877218.1 carbon-nitrogen hydrolase family protein [Roseibium polysiphoniae]